MVQKRKSGRKEKKERSEIVKFEYLPTSPNLERFRGTTMCSESDHHFQFMWPTGSLFFYTYRNKQDAKQNKIV